MATNIKLVGIHVNTGCSQGRKQRKCLIYFSGYMQIYIFGNAAVIGVEVFIFPLKFGVGGAFVILPAIVNTYGQNIICIKAYRIGNIKTKSRNTILMRAYQFAI